MLPESPGKRVLVCALDWGLGHATRTACLVRHWQGQGAQVTLAGNGRSLAWWRKEFPELPVRELPDYGVRYAPGLWLVPGLLLSLGRILRAIAQEHRLVHAWAQEFDAVVSDNRYGAWTTRIPSILLTHQLHLAAPPGLEWAEVCGEWLMARLCRRFTEIWVPDYADQGLSGKLGHPLRVQWFPKLRWIGPLSRFQNPLPSVDLWDRDWETVALVSGPEPARSDFEDFLWKTLQHQPGRHLLVCGRPDLPFPTADLPEHGVVRVPHLDSPSLATALRRARRIVSRGGYSTVLDLEALGLLDGRCGMIPTPGQTEQEYLAQFLTKTRGVTRGTG